MAGVLLCLVRSLKLFKEEMETLNEIGLKHKTDKASSTHGYLDTYEKYLGAWRDKEFTLLEIGVAAGNSLRMWREYFPKAKIYGIDNNPDCIGYGEGIFIGSQTDSIFLSSVISKTGTPDIIIDDASHFAPNTIFTFRELFPKVATGGYYIIEDTCCFYNSTYGLAPPYGEGMSEVFTFFSGLCAHVDVHGRGMCGNADFAINHGTKIPPVPEFSRILDSMYIHPSLWWFKRK